MITFKFRAYPNYNQQHKLWQHANLLNKTYNYFLNQKIEAYEKDKRSIKKSEQQTELTQLKVAQPELKEIYSQVLQQVTDRLDKTYKSFFNRGYGFPNFRSCKNFFGITYPQSGFKIDSNKLITTAYGTIKFKKHRYFLGDIKQITITSKYNKWFICITTDYIKPESDAKGIVGIDVGISNAVATSDGNIIKSQNHNKYFDKQINTLKSRRDLLCKRGSNHFRFLTKVVRRLYGAKHRKVLDFLHKVSYNLSQSYDTIVCENLNLKQMSESKIKGLNRELRSSQLAKLISLLEYKTNNLLKVNPMNTSKTCNRCGSIHDMPLSKRIYECECGYKEDRDINAAKNILCLGQAILKRGYAATITLQEALAFRQE